MKRFFCAVGACLLLACAPTLAETGSRASSPEERARDAAAFNGIVGYMWWIVPSNAPRQTFMASGYGGQLIWVYPPLELVVAITSTVSQESQRRGHAIQLLRGKLFNAAQQRAASAP
jgi:CubicO group peptidase (beta-lactamase class C family)